MIGVGVIGYGYWGPNLVRNFYESAGSRVVSVCDLNPDRLTRVGTRYPNIGTTRDAMDLIRDSKVDAVVISTPVSSHFDLALKALRCGKHVLVEKPLTSTSDQAMRLIDEAARRRLVLMVDHTFVYTGPVRKIRELVHSHSLGEIYYFDSVRINLGLFQHDVNVVWDLAVHDLSIMDYVLPTRPCAVSATGISNIPGEPENVAFLTSFFEGNLIAHVHVNWLAPVKVRRTIIGGSRKMVLYDDLEPSEKIKVYDKGIQVNNEAESVYRMLISYRTGEMHAPTFDTTEALQREVSHFIECVEGNGVPLTPGEAGLRIVRMLEAAVRSMRASGRPVELDLESRSGRLPPMRFRGSGMQEHPLPGLS
jgi:predicted dehydrogenase